MITLGLLTEPIIQIIQNHKQRVKNKSKCKRKTQQKRAKTYVVTSRQGAWSNGWRIGDARIEHAGYSAFSENHDGISGYAH